MTPRRLATLVAIPAIAYGAVAGALYVGQDALLFRTVEAQAGPSLPPAATRLTLTATDDVALQGVHLPARHPGAGPRLLVLGFGGNAWNADGLALFLRDRLPAADIVTFHFRGYAPSGGAPSAAALQADALAVHDLVRARFAPDRLVAVGFSLGSAVAAHLASRRPVDGLVLVSPFDSLAALAAEHYPWLPVRLLLRHRLAPADDMRDATAPTAVIAAGRDTLVPPARTAPVRAAARNLVFDRIVADAGHIDLYGHPGFAAALAAALERVAGAAGD